MPFESNHTLGAVSQCGETRIREDVNYPQSTGVCVVHDTVRFRFDQCWKDKFT